MNANKRMPKIIFRCGDVILQKWEEYYTSDGKHFKECFQIGKLTKKLNKETNKWEQITQTINVTLGVLAQMSYIIEASMEELGRREWGK